MGRTAPRGSTHSVHLYFLFLPFLYRAALSARLFQRDAREKLVAIKRIAVFLKLTAVYTLIIHKQFTDLNGKRNKQLFKTVLKTFPKNAAEEHRPVITCRNIYVQLEHTETQNTTSYSYRDVYVFRSTRRGRTMNTYRSFCIHCLIVLTMGACFRHQPKIEKAIATFYLTIQTFISQF